MKRILATHAAGCAPRSRDRERRGAPLGRRQQLDPHDGARRPPRAGQLGRPAPAARSPRRRRPPRRSTNRTPTGVVAIKAVTAEGEDSGTGIVLNEQRPDPDQRPRRRGREQHRRSAPAGSSSVTRTATLVGEEANEDLALIKVDPVGLRPEAAEPRELELRAGRRLGLRDRQPLWSRETLTRGIVSALNREISAPDGSKITGAIQTDAALNPATPADRCSTNEGEVIGVNSQIASEAASVEGSQPWQHRRRLRDRLGHRRPGRQKIEAGRGRHLRFGDRAAGPKVAACDSVAL